MQLRKPRQEHWVSETERDAKRAVVDAVEGRWRRVEAFRRRAALRKVLANVSAVLLLGAMAVAAVFCYRHSESAAELFDKARACFSPGREPAETGPARVVPAPLLDGAPDKSVIKKAVETVVAKPDPSAGFQERYLRLVTDFSEKPLSPWSQVADAIRPKNAPTGTVYHLLVPRRPAGYDIYAMTTGAKEMAYELLSPIAKPVRVKPSDFRAACANAAYLIERDGQVYWSGKGAADEAKALQRRLLAVRGAGDAR